MKILSKLFVSLLVMVLVLIPSLNCLDVEFGGPGDNNDVKRQEEKDTIAGTPKVNGSSKPEDGASGSPDSQPGSENFFWETYKSEIDYGNPDLYLASGSQSKLNERYFNEINEQIVIEGNDVKGVGTIFGWKQSYFDTYSAGGRFIGKITVNQIMEKKALSGCHDHGLVLVSILRKYGFPAIMVDAAGIQWALDYSGGKREGFSGHVFAEVYVKDRWILIDSTSGRYIENYDPDNPVIPITNSVEGKGYFALFKGLDPEGYGINSNEELTGYLEAFAKEIKSIKTHAPPYKIKKLP